MQIAHLSRRTGLVVGVATFFALALIISTVMNILMPKSTHAPRADSPATTSTKKPAAAIPSPAKPLPKPPAFDKTKYSTTSSSSLWAIVNKQHPLIPSNYAPNDLIKGAGGYYYSSRISADLTALIDAAAKQGVVLSVGSAYRSYAAQTSLYNGYVAQYGQATADTISARPGYSEHQTGLAVDINGNSNPSCNFDVCFGNTAEGKWLAFHATEYGFVIRYSKDATAINGYSYEPWHIRYVGHELATEYKKEDATSLEAFFSVSGGSAYNN
jgi:D-alanyl-D-alanine carboxypeptidase